MDLVYSVFVYLIILWLYCRVSSKSVAFKFRQYCSYVHMVAVSTAQKQRVEINIDML